MTEDEAKTKICCGPPGTNAMMAGVHINADEVLTNCVASECMAWRWHFRCGENPDNPAEAISLPPIEGHCGLAGRPA